MREEDILDNSYDDNFFFGLKNQKKCLSYHVWVWPQVSIQ